MHALIYGIVVPQTHGKWKILEGTDGEDAVGIDEYSGVLRLWEGNVVDCLDPRLLCIKSAWHHLSFETPIGSSNSFLQNYCHLYSYCFYCFDCINNVKIEANVAKTLAKRSTWKPPATASCIRKVQESKKNELVKWTFITTKLRSMKKQKNKIFAPEKYLAGYIQRFSLS